MLRGVARRFKMYNFKGPLMITTDQCCNERAFWCGDESRDPIFESLKRRGVDCVGTTEITE